MGESTTASAGTTTCPLCESAALRPAGQVVDLNRILGQWETSLDMVFPPEVRSAYAGVVTALYRCSVCHYAAFLPPPAGTDPFYASVFAKIGYDAGKWEFRQAIRDIRRQGARRVLDIGCGSGVFLNALRQALPAVEADGYEHNSDASRDASAKGFRVIHGPFPDVLYGDIRGYDAVCSFQVLEHVPDPVRFLQGIRQVLRPGGRIVLAVPDAAGPVRHFQDALTDLPPHHLSRWQAETFRRGVVHQGFSVVRIAREPLPHYLWDSYLPVIVARDWFPSPIARVLTRRSVVVGFSRFLKFLGLRWLYGVRGHTLYVVLKAD